MNGVGGGPLAFSGLKVGVPPLSLLPQAQNRASRFRTELGPSSDSAVGLGRPINTSISWGITAGGWEDKRSPSWTSPGSWSAP